jgi:branched-chain amino acid transport system permease protein
MISFVTSSFFAGVGGGLLAMYQCMAQANNFKASMTYEILLIVVIGGIGSITGSVLASFLFTACNEWWLRFLDDESLGVPLFRGGFRKVVFAVIIMLIVLFYRRGIMGDRELDLDAAGRFFRTLPARLRALPARLRARSGGKGAR